MKTRSIWIICLAVILVCFLASKCHGQQVTNLPVTITVTVVTNVSWSDNEPPKTLYDSGFGNLGWQNPMWHSATEKTETTTVTEITYIEFELNGPRKIRDEKLVRQSKKVFKLKQEWEKVSDGPVEISRDRILYMTNMISINHVWATNIIAR